MLGATGMLGNAVFERLGRDPRLDVWGTIRDRGASRFFAESRRSRLLTGVDVINEDALASALSTARPEVIINCVGVIKQLPIASDPLVVLPVNAMLPHRLSRYCAAVASRLIHISTDCVFAGTRGNYRESDAPDATDLYGQSKLIGEVRDQRHAITLRSSIIGHELQSNHALIDWFLSQQGRVKGYTRAIFSGVPVAEMARIIGDVVLPRPELHGLYHVAAAPIAKCELLRLVAAEYGKAIEIVPDDSVVVDRSLNGDRFTDATGYVAPPWPDLVRLMRASRTV